MDIGNISEILKNHPLLVFLGGVVAKWAITKILDKLPNYIKYEFRYNIKSLNKWWFNSPIDVLLNYKISKISIKLEDYETEIKRFMKKNDFTFKNQKGNDYTYTYKFGSINPEITISPSYEIKNNNDSMGEAYVYCIELRIKLNTGFRSFKDDINESDKLKQKLNLIFKNKYNELGLDSTVFYLSDMYKLTGILKEINLNSLYGQLGENKVDLYDNKIVVYGMILTKELIKIKRIITYYY